ncbi:MAG: hypothetical protein KKB34_10165 [Bacteroidetes bacterium]|nr:hypothetical protein [Bacteroidota bacterium]
MQINSKTILKNLIGENLISGENKPLSLGEALSNILLNDKVGSKMKCYILAEKFFKDNTVEIDEADLSLVKESIQRTELYNNLVNGQLLILIGK